MAMSLPSKPLVPVASPAVIVVEDSSRRGLSNFHRMRVARSAGSFCLVKCLLNTRLGKSVWVPHC